MVFGILVATRCSISISYQKADCGQTFSLVLNSVTMMRSDSSRDEGIFSTLTPYSSLETSSGHSEYDMPMARHRRSKGRCISGTLCVALLVIAAIVSGVVVGVKKHISNEDKTGALVDPNVENIRSKLYAPVPGPAPSSTFPKYASPPAPPKASSPVTTAPAPAPLTAFAPLSNAPSAFGVGEATLDEICLQSQYPTLCTSLFASNPHAQKVDIQQWTIIAMQSAESAVNESYRLVTHMEKGNSGSVALTQCLQVMADSLDQLNTSMYLVADMDPSSPGTTVADVQTYMSAAMTDQDTCQQGISEVGGWPGSDLICGARADHVNGLLSIALTFVNSLRTTGGDLYHHRRLLSLHPHAVGSILGRRGLLSLQTSRRTNGFMRATTYI